MELDLMDWKNIEMHNEQQIRAAEVTIVIESILLKHAKKNIKELGGKTSEEEKEDLKKKLKR